MRKMKIDGSNIQVFSHLVQNYEAEFSPLTGKHPDGRGLYALDVEISAERPGYLAYEGDIPIGLAVLGTHQGISDIAEFYIVPSFRRQSFGKRFAFELFDMRPGAWQVRQIQGADKARNFWRVVINEYTGGEYAETVENDPYWGPVTRQAFTGRTAKV